MPRGAAAQRLYAQRAVWASTPWRGKACLSAAAGFLPGCQMVAEQQRRRVLPTCCVRACIMRVQATDAELLRVHTQSHLDMVSYWGVEIGAGYQTKP